MEITKYIVLCFSLIALPSCIKTKLRDFTDPDFISFTVKKLLVVTPSQEFDDIFIQTLAKKNIDVSANRFSDAFLPTRKYNKEEMLDIIKSNGYEATINITIAGDQSSSQVISYMTNSSAQVYSTGYGNAYATGQSTAIPITARNRNTASKAELYNPITQRKIWVADLNTEASGALYVQNDDTMKSISEETINSLLKRRHLVVKATKK